MNLESATLVFWSSSVGVTNVRCSPCVAPVGKVVLPFGVTNVDCCDINPCISFNNKTLFSSTYITSYINQINTIV